MAGTGQAPTCRRTVAIGSIDGTDEIPTDDVRAAVGGIWTRSSAIWPAPLIGAASASSSPPASCRRWIRARSGAASSSSPDVPQQPWALGLRGVAIAAVGIIVLLFPGPSLLAIAYLLGAALVLVGSTELLTALGRPTTRTKPTDGAALRRRTAVAAGTALITVLAASGAAALVLDDEGPARLVATPTAGCNGLPELCDRRLNEVLFPGTHNAMAAADVAGWSIPNQRRSIARQLTDGMRLFLLDPHYGRTLRTGRVQTDFDEVNRDANKVARELSPAALTALDRLGVSISRSSGTRGPREVWLCHTVCELGATRMDETLRTMGAYLRANPSTVLMLILESYVSDAHLQEAFAKTDTEQYAATLSHGKPLPTLGELIAEGKRLVVFTEKVPRDRTIPWLNDAFSWIQDTPLGAQQPSQLQCKRYRGSANSPFLMLNHWIDRFPPPPSANGAILTRDFLRKRIAQCEEARGMPVSLIATDFYEQGAVIDVAREINRAR